MHQCVVNAKGHFCQLDRPVGGGTYRRPSTCFAARVARPFRSIVLIEPDDDNMVMHIAQFDVLATLR
jgi:hypothetical protein